MSLSSGRIFVIYLPLAWIGVLAFGYTGILAAAVAANLLVVLGALIAAQSVGLFRTRKRLIAVPAQAFSTA
ncbi:hypothetical protein [Ruegeria profundi]|uniref:Uncharacterized protein n=1 Tax=Ruegeria profundi TaxID=1685378 RepID=A0A0X3TNF6_9RHOB|nr:hypothetical protein [Ruegeria profundi]KUJ77288.1 hypothetical protein AVO44_18075 [Ruegeria profundi]